MKEHTRVAIAYIAGRIISKVQSNTIYDFSKSSHKNISGQEYDNRVNVYGYDKNCHISGNSSGSGLKYRLYHYGDSNYISLEIRDNQFKGCDYETSYYFSGTIQNRSISLYDYETSSFYNYSI